MKKWKIINKVEFTLMISIQALRKTHVVRANFEQIT